MMHLFDNQTIGLALMAVLVFFVGSLLLSIFGCFRSLAVTQAANFNYVATAVAGLVLTVASGALGVAPGAVRGPQPVSAEAAAAEPTPQVPAVTLATAQVGAFKQLYTATYIVVGLVCLLVFMIPTPRTPELVKNVALTTLAFLGLFVSKNLNSAASNDSVDVNHPAAIQLVQPPGGSK